MKLKPEAKEKWLEALRSGRYAQTNGFLHIVSGDEKLIEGEQHAYCCLGVLCEVAIEAGLDLPKRRRLMTPKTKERVVAYGESGIARRLPREVMEWAGLPSETGEYQMADGSIYSLSEANDQSRLPFEMIASLIENLDENDRFLDPDAWEASEPKIRLSAGAIPHNTNF